MSEEFIVGDVIVDNFGIYKITEIKANPESKGKPSTLVYYKPAVDSEKAYVSYIPIGNLKKAGLRKIISSKDAQALVKKFASLGVADSYVFNVAKDEVYYNDPNKLIPILSYIWINQETLSKVDKELMEQILENLSREIAFATNEKKDKVREDITKRLSKLN